MEIVWYVKTRKRQDNSIIKRMKLFPCEQLDEQLPSGELGQEI